MRTDRVLAAGIAVLGVLSNGSPASYADAGEPVSASGGGSGVAGSGAGLPTAGEAGANEVAAAADERGFDGDAVRTSIRLFEAVRYGDRPVIEGRERRAESAVEPIERSGGRGP